MKYGYYISQLAKKGTEDSTPRLGTVRSTDDVSPRSRSMVDVDNKLLSDKLKMSEQRNSEYRNQVQGLRNDLKMAQKVCVHIVYWNVAQ